MLEDDIAKLWAKGGSHISMWSVGLARNDYSIMREAIFVTNCGAPYKQTAELVRAHLIEALSSPMPYIREWGKLIAAEQNPIE